MTSSWSCVILDEFSPKNTGESKRDEDLPCRLRKNISNLIWEQDRNATLNIFLYIWGQKWTAYAVHDQRSYLMDRAKKLANLRKFRGHWIVRMIWAIERSASILRTTQFSKRIKMESQVHFDLENFFRIKIINVSEETSNFNMRVWSWLRMNAGGVPNTCKSNGTIRRWFRSDPYSLVADGWVTRGQPASHWGIAAGNGW